jgi:hypothetical protein
VTRKAVKGGTTAARHHERSSERCALHRDTDAATTRQRHIALLSFALLCFALPCFALHCFALLSFALLCFALLSFALLSFALLLCSS